MTKKLFPPLLVLLGLLFSVNVMAAEYSVKCDNKSNFTSQTFFTFTKGTDSPNVNTNYKGTYKGYTYTQGLKMESATKVSFTTTTSATLTIVQGLTKNSKYYIKLDDTQLNNCRTDDATNQVGIYTINIESGDHSITRGDGETGILFISVKELDVNTVVQPIINYKWSDAYNEPTTVTITSATDGANIYYTTDGSAPSSSSTLYEDAFTVTKDCTVKAIAIKDGMTDSEVTSANVTINNQRQVSFDFTGYNTTGLLNASTKVVNGDTYTLPKGRSYFIANKTQTGWKDTNDNEYKLGAEVTIDKDFTFSPVFTDNTVALGDAKTTVDWTFATSKGAPSVGYEGNIGYYTQQATINNIVVDVPMTINTMQDAGVSGSHGKFNTTSADNRAQVNKGTVFIIPAIKGMTVTYTVTANDKNMKDESVSFNGENGTKASDGKSISYTYNGNDATLKIIDITANFYPSGLNVTYPAVSSYNVTVNQTIGYSTMYYEKELKVPADTKAYTAELNDDKLVLTELADGIIPAKTAVLVSGNGGVFEASNTGATFTGTNDLKGSATTIETSSVDGGIVCTLANENGTTAFYNYNGTTLAANKAFLVVPTTATGEAKAIRIVFNDNATGINNIANAESKANATIYNIAGQRVTKNAKGLVIVNGKKYIK